MDAKTQKENERRVAEEYLSSLKDLNCNSKPLINMLTMLAEENIEYAAVIVQVVEEHIAKVPADFKLPILYLIDSIVKNVKSAYVQLFSQCIVNIFCGVFEMVNEKVRERMYPLRQTWNEVFPPQKLYTLDVKVKRMDQNWPITAKPPQPSIHVNPLVFPKMVNAASVIPNEMEEILQAKTRELLELKKMKLELELEATKKHLEEQEKQLSKTTEGVAPPGVDPVRPPAPLHAPPHMIPPAQQPMPGVLMRPGIYNFRNARPPHPGLPMPPQGYPNMPNMMVKPKVNPVNPSMLSSMRHRDPRLARQQQQQQQQTQQVIPHHPIPHQIHVNRAGPQLPKILPTTTAESNAKESSSSYRGSGSSRKSSRSGGSGGSGSESKSPTRHSSSSARSTGRSNKSSSSSHKDSKDQRKRSESKSSTTSSSSGGSHGSLERHKSSSNAEKYSSSSSSGAAAVKCDKDAFEIAPLSTAFKRKSSSPASSPSKSKRDSKMRSYSRKHRSRSNSPLPEHPSQDIDLRSPHKSPEKRHKQRRDSATTTTTVEKEEKPSSETISKELDKTTSSASSSTTIANRKTSISEDNEKKVEKMIIDNIDDDGKKRPSTETIKEEEPLPKKSKSAKLDALFGSEDVDLRTVMPPQLMGVQKQETVSTPPPPVISDEEGNGQASNENQNKQNFKSNATAANKNIQKKSSSLDDVRAKLAKTAKIGTFSKFDKNNKELSQRFKLTELNTNEDTQEANDEKVRTIITQAQELLESKSINHEQYRNLLQTVMSINETNKLKEAKRRESLNAAKAKLQSIEEDNDDSHTERQAAREAILKKRIPKLRRNSANPNANASPVGSPLYEDSLSQDGVQKPKTAHKEKRTKTSKWDRNENISSNAAAATAVPAGGTADMTVMLPHRGWAQNAAANNKRQPNSFAGYRGVPHPPMPPMPNPNLRLPQLAPWQMGMPPVFNNPSQMPMIRGNIPPPPQPPQVPVVLPGAAVVAPPIPKPCNSIDNPQADLVRTITIDGMAKEIRIYDKVAIVFMELDQPREIGFQAGQRSICIDNQEPFSLKFNDDFKTILIGAEKHNIRFGFPSRELYIDEHWYEIYFGGSAVSIPIRNRMHILKAEGPPPQVNIGPLRRDLVVGKINMIVDAHTIIPVFLDARLQSFRLGEHEHTIQFVDNLLNVLLDGEIAKIEYGGLPKSFMLGGKKYFIRFGALPKGIEAGKVRIREMVYVKTEAITAEEVSQEAIKEEISKNKETVKMESEKSADVSVAPAVPLLNIDDLLQKLVSSGILGKTKPVTGSTATVNSDSNTGNTTNGNSATAKESPDSTNSTTAMSEEAAAVEPIRPIDLEKSETIKTRQSAIVQSLFSGMQCSSCGVRFPPEQTIKYSQHLDWHFRQNRRERDSVRKAHSRKWYYELSDWIQYEEIEDMDEREKNFFETQQAEFDMQDDASNQRSSNSPTPAVSCAAAPDEVDRACDVCQEKFEHFYNEEQEEWHLRLAVREDDKIYHPLCYEDHKASLNPPKKEEEKTTKAEEIINDDNAMDEVIKIEGDEAVEDLTSVTIADDDDDDDDVIVLPNDEPSITEIVDDDEDEYVPANVTKEEMGVDDTPIENAEKENDDHSEDDDMNDTTESDVEIQEPNIPFTDLDNYVEKELPEPDESSQLSFGHIKIKEEPKDDDEEEDDGFEDVGTFVPMPPLEEISIQDSEDTQMQTTSAASPSANIDDINRPASVASLIQLDNESSEPTPSGNTDLNISMDGDLEATNEHNLSAAAPLPAVALASLVNRIKINISKNTVSSTNSSSTSSSNSVSSQATHDSHPITTTTTTTTSNLSSTTCPSLSSTDKNKNISTIPVLCGGAMSQSNYTASAVPEADAGSASNVISAISVIGSYGSSAPTVSRYHQHTSHKIPTTSATTTTTVVSATTQVAPVVVRKPTPPPPEDSITYEQKPALKKATLKKMKKIESGVETSGLCSLM